MRLHDLKREVKMLALMQGTELIRVPTRDGGASYLTRRLDGSEIADPPIYSSLASVYLALTTPRDSRQTEAA